VFSHATLGVTDFDRALGFYGPLMVALGHELRFCDRAVPWAGWQPRGQSRPLFIIMHPFNGQPAAPGQGAMLAFDVPDRQTLRRAHAAGLALGGSDEGAPGLRPQYHASYYGAYLRDPDGNKLCLVCHAPEAAS